MFEIRIIAHPSSAKSECHRAETSPGSLAIAPSILSHQVQCITYMVYKNCGCEIINSLEFFWKLFKIPVVRLKDPSVKCLVSLILARMLFASSVDLCSYFGFVIQDVDTVPVRRMV